MGQYFRYAQELWKNESIYLNTTQSVVHTEVYSGFYGSLSKNKFLKCFSINLKKNIHHYIRRIRFNYDLSRMISEWHPESTKARRFNTNLAAHVKIHYPGQFFLGDTPIFFGIHQKSDYYAVFIKELEVLKRRNTRSKKCLKDTNAFDSMVVDEHISSKRCRAPYLILNKKGPVCNTAGKMKDGLLRYEEASLTSIAKPCHRISKIKTNDKKEESKFPSSSKIWYFRIQFPREIKVITQSKEIDIHSLIGNIGGYIGLFLGKFSKIKWFCTQLST